MQGFNGSDKLSESPFCCPNCQGTLYRTENGLRCANGHCFDRAKSGYYNLLLPAKGGRKFHGDNPLMVRARREFLEKGYYAPLLKALQKAVQACQTAGGSLLDCGCGEGYYTEGVLDAVSGNMQVLGVDISKDAVHAAAKRCRGGQFAVASTFHLPVKDESTSMLLQIFSPHCTSEFLRVLQKDGIFIEIFPGKNHLWSLKAALYDTPYKNEPMPFEEDGFALLSAEHIENKIFLSCQADIENLFKMTPYYYKTGKQEQARLQNLQALSVETDFHLLLYRKL